MTRNRDIGVVSPPFIGTYGPRPYTASEQRVSFTWATRREGNQGFVLETRPNGSREVYGPMPCGAVEPFIATRRDLIRRGMLEELYAVPIFEDYSFMQTKKGSA